MKRFVGNLKMWQKFALIGVLSLGMVAAPSVLVVRSDWAALQTAHAEASGMAPAGQVIKLIQLTQQHRGIAARSRAHVERPARRDTAHEATHQRTPSGVPPVALLQRRRAAELVVVHVPPSAANHSGGSAALR